jgi:hypothetical protein
MHQEWALCIRNVGMLLERIPRGFCDAFVLGDLNIYGASRGYFIVPVPKK